MRHIQLEVHLRNAFADADGQKLEASLKRAHKRLAKKRTAKRRRSYLDSNGGRKWKPIKERLINALGRKCWYTEVELTGAALAVDHYRPKSAYWWLAFDATNYRLACPWSNSPELNVKHGLAGGKGEKFPLLAPSIAAKRKCHLPNECPIILDPCARADCQLLAFQADGRPILHPSVAADPVARERVEQSMLLLNLDHPDFNSKREQLCREISEDVRTHEELPAASEMRATIRARIERRLGRDAQFSTAARFYLMLHRHLGWVDEILSR